MQFKFQHQIPLAISLLIVITLCFWVVPAMPSVALEALPIGGLSLSPIHSGSNTQTKTGSLTMGSVLAPRYICLNASDVDMADPVSSDNCISSWDSLSSGLAGFVSANSNAVPSPIQLSNYLSQAGFIDLKASNGQSAAAVVRAPVFTACITPAVGPKVCANNNAKPCATNLDCGQVGTAVFGSSGSSGSGRAGSFNGTVYVKSRNGLAGGYGQICLGSSPTTINTVITNTDCLSSWNEIGPTSSDYVKRFVPASGATPITCSGNICGTPQTTPGNGAMITGVARFGGIIVGRSNTIGNIALTCGNGVCETVEQTANTCPIDCNSIPMPTIEAGLHDMSMGNNTIQVTVSAGGASAALLVVRSTDTTPVFRPIDGVIYSENMIIGNNKIIKVINSPSTNPYSFYDTLTPSLVLGQSYTYLAFQANAFPRYSNSGTLSVKTVIPYLVTLTTNHPDKVRYYGLVEDGSYTINYNAWPTKLINSQTIQTLEVDSIESGYCFSSWTNCTGNSSSCTATINSNLTISLNITPC